MAIVDDGRALIKQRLAAKRKAGLARKSNANNLSDAVTRAQNAKPKQPLQGHALEDRNKYGKDVAGYLKHRDDARLAKHAQTLKEHPERFDANGRPIGKWKPAPRPVDPDPVGRFRPDRPGAPKQKMRPFPKPPGNMEKMPRVLPDKPGQKPRTFLPVPTPSNTAAQIGAVKRKLLNR